MTRPTLAVPSAAPACWTSALRVLGFVLAAVLASSPARADGLTTMGGAEADLNGYVGSGKWRVVMIWSVNCHICFEEMPNYGALHTQRKDSDLEVLGVSLDGPGSEPLVQAFLDDRNGSFPNLIADLGPFARAYADQVGEPLMGTPTFLVFDPDGELVGSQPGPMRVVALESFVARKNAEAGR